MYICDASESATNAIVIIWQEEFTDRVHVTCNKYLCVSCSARWFNSTTTGCSTLPLWLPGVVWQYAIVAVNVGHLIDFINRF